MGQTGQRCKASVGLFSLAASVARRCAGGLRACCERIHLSWSEHDTVAFECAEDHKQDLGTCYQRVAGMLGVSHHLRCITYCCKNSSPRLQAAAARYPAPALKSRPLRRVQPPELFHCVSGKCFELALRPTLAVALLPVLCSAVVGGVTAVLLASNAAQRANPRFIVCAVIRPTPQTTAHWHVISLCRCLWDLARPPALPGVATCRSHGCLNTPFTDGRINFTQPHAPGLLHVSANEFELLQG